MTAPRNEAALTGCRLTVGICADLDQLPLTPAASAALAAAAQAFVDDPER